MTIIESRKLEKQKKRDKQNSLIRDLIPIHTSEANKDKILQVIKYHFPETRPYLLMTKARCKRLEEMQCEAFPKVLLDTELIEDSSILQLFIELAPSVQTITSSSFSTMLKQHNKQYEITKQLILLNKINNSYKFDCGLEREEFLENIDNMILVKKLIKEPSTLILTQTNLTIFSVSDYTKQSQYNIGFECFLNDDGIMKTRYECDYFFKFKHTMQNFCDEFGHDELPIREKKDFEFLKNYTLSHKDFDNGTWKEKWDNIFFVGTINRQLEKYLVTFLQIPIIDASNLSQRTLLIVSREKIDFIAKYQTKNLTSRIEIVGLHDKENKIELRKDYFINYFVPEGIQIHPENLSKDSIVYIHIRTSKMGSQIKYNFQTKLKQYLPDITIVESIHNKEELKDKEGRVITTKKGVIRYKSVLVEEKVKQLSHIVVFQKDQIKFISDMVEKYKITLILNESIDFEKLRQIHYPQQEIQLERNFLNFSQINRDQQIEVLDRLVKSIRMDEKEIFCRITHPIFELIDILKKIFPYLKKDILDNNKVIRIGFIDHADHAKNQVQVRNENIAIYYDKSLMEEGAKAICNKYHNWGAFLSPDKKDCIEKIGFLKGSFFADVVSFPVSHKDKLIYFFWGKTTGDNKDQLAQINKWRKHKRCPNCNKDYHTNNTNKKFFSFADFCKCERNTIATCLKIFLDALNSGKSWQEAAFIASEDGYMGAPSHMVVGFFYRLFQIYHKSNSRKEIEEYTLSLLNDVLQIADILHDGFGVSGLLCRSFEAHSWLDKEKFEEFCLKLTGKTTSDFMGGNYRKLLMNCHLFLEKTVGYEQHCCISEIGDSFSKIMKSTFYCWREIYFFSYQSALQSLEFFQFYLQTLLFFLSTLLQQLPDTFDIRKTYTHGIFHYPDLWTITDLVNGCSESGENVNYRMSVAAHLSCHYSQNIFKKFKTSEQIIFNKEEEKKKSKIAKLQNELNKFITETKYKFQEIELEFIIEDEDFKAFYNLILQYKDQNFYTCEQRDGKYFFKTNVSQKINDYFTLNFLNK